MVITIFMTIKYDFFLNGIFRIILCSSLLINIIRRLWQNIEYYKQCIKIEGGLDILNNCKNKKNISTLQSMLEDRRKMPVIEKNMIHKRKAKSLSEYYNKISNDN